MESAEEAKSGESEESAEEPRFLGRCGEGDGCFSGGRESRRCKPGSLPFPPSRGRGGTGGRGWGGGQGRSLGDGLRLRGKMTWASVRKKLSTVSRTFMIYDL